ncbi:MAG: hypothetical protein PHO91_00785 [Patescibacteria group bacterium]|nr:hypothetical protein [Patescibacteria group bacterium]
MYGKKNQNTKQLIETAYQEALAKIDKVEKSVDLKIKKRIDSREKDEIDAILDKINTQF